MPELIQKTRLPTTQAYRILSSTPRYLTSNPGWNRHGKRKSAQKSKSVGTEVLNAASNAEELKTVIWSKFENTLGANSRILCGTPTYAVVQRKLHYKTIPLTI